MEFASGDLPDQVLQKPERACITADEGPEKRTEDDNGSDRKERKDMQS